MGDGLTDPARWTDTHLSHFCLFNVISSSSSPPSSSPHLQSLALRSGCALCCPSSISLLSVCPLLPWTQYTHTNVDTHICTSSVSSPLSSLLPTHSLPPPHLLPLLLIKPPPSPLCLLCSSHVSKLHSKHRRRLEERWVR